MTIETKKNTVKSGMLWSFMIQGGTQIINFVVTIILARLLLPEQFGLLGMIAVFIAISRGLLDGGLASSLIRTKDPNNEDYSTVFFVNLGSSIVLYVILFFVAPYISMFYKHEILISLVRVLGLLLIVNAFTLVQSTKLNKSLQFKTQFKLQIPSLIISASLSIWMAYNGYGVWSLVAKDLAYAAIATVQLWWYAKWTPSFLFNKEKFIYHLNFGYKLSITAIINTIFENLYYIVIGKYFSAVQLGYFTRARSLEQLPSGFFYNAFNRVFYPLLANLGGNDAQLKNTYSKLMQIVVFVVTPILVYLGIIATPFFRWLLTDKWLPAVPYFQLLLISGIFYPVHQYNLNICNLKGRSDMVLKLSLLHNVLLFLGAFTAIWFGIFGLLYSLIIINIFITGVNSYYSGKLIGFGLSKQLIDLMPIFVLNAIVGVTVYTMQIIWFIKMSDKWNLLINLLLFFLLYGSLAFLFQMRALNNILKQILK
ncbi:lipopolysaccharide biosynthesis protein [Flavobacterium sp. KS-LB2]|uniref:lipopolysaccharide biosynthesis protein n=1 Tax=Flavobacterium sp. KS-LB2 TaxID=3120525 RepID=UPI0030D37415